MLYTFSLYSPKVSEKLLQIRAGDSNRLHMDVLVIVTNYLIYIIECINMEAIGGTRSPAREVVAHPSLLIFVTFLNGSSATRTATRDSSLLCTLPGAAALGIDKFAKKQM